MSKGSGRRPQQVSEEEAAANWARVFGKGQGNSQPIDKESREIKCAEASEKALAAPQAQ